MEEMLLETHELTKAYGKRNVVDGVNISVKRGAIYGLIGKNGAGKTTFMKMIAGMIRPTDGTYEYKGFKGGNSEAYGKIGALIEIPAIMPNLNARDNMKLKCIAYNHNDDHFITDTLKLVGLGDTGKKKASKFSLGMKQRLGIALALVGNPDILILDEPINGLDPQGIAEVREVLTRLNQERGITIIISSHILAELAKLATDYAIIDNGRIVEVSTREELERKSRNRMIFKCEDSARAAAVLKEAGYTGFEVGDHETIYVYENTDDAPKMNMKICQAGILVNSFDYEVADLEEYFLNTIRSAAASPVTAEAGKEAAV
ncbi:ABC-2 type transport system ATP-binding protein [Ruminococcaceae bacterium YRB3002]|nr:ABC-2 type transport system ATP-binding protein [Ruminococcaceae bacterium YRB3002]